MVLEIEVGDYAGVIGSKGPSGTSARAGKDSRDRHGAERVDKVDPFDGSGGGKEIGRSLILEEERPGETVVPGVQQMPRVRISGIRKSTRPSTYDRGHSAVPPRPN